MTDYKDIKKSTIWKVQYKHRDEAIKTVLKEQNPKEYKKYIKLPIPRKMLIIDNLHKKGAL